MNSPDASSDEELLIFVERLRHFMNLWTIYTDMLTGKYVPSLGAQEQSVFNPSVTVMLLLYAYLYSLIEDSSDGLNAFRDWRSHFPEEEQAIAAIEAQVVPFRDDLRIFRNRLGFHGSRSRTHEAPGFDFFGKFKGDYTWDAMKNFKALAATLLAKDIARNASDEANLKKHRAWIDAIAASRKAMRKLKTKSPPFPVGFGTAGLNLMVAHVGFEPTFAI